MGGKTCLKMKGGVWEKKKTVSNYKLVWESNLFSSNLINQQMPTWQGSDEQSFTVYQDFN